MMIFLAFLVIVVVNVLAFTVPISLRAAMYLADSLDNKIEDIERELKK